MIRIGTRGSDLALWQARHVAGRLTAAGETTEIIVLVTRGDRIDDVPLQEVEGKGFFTSELEQALLEKRIDLAVHSHKDLPGAMIPELVIAAVPAREVPEERLLIAPAAFRPEAPFLPLARGARVGTSAPRRAAQLAALRPDLQLLALRGNVPTRVRRLREGRYDAIVLAAAGLQRLGLDLGGLEAVTLERGRFVPAPGQGALAIQTRTSDAALRALCARVLADPLAAETVAAERELLQTLGGGCNLPLGVSLQAEGDGSWSAWAFLGPDHPRPGHPARWCRTRAPTPAAAAEAVGRLLLQGTRTGQGPLGATTVALTGSAGAAEELEARLATLGARVLREEVTEIEELAAPTLGARLATLRRGDALVLTSAHAARRLQGHAVPSGVCVAVVGKATARALAAAGIEAERIGGAGAGELARSLTLDAGARVLFPCAETPRTELEQELGPRGVNVERLVLYRTRARAGVSLAPEADVRVYLSPSAVQAALAAERSGAPRARRVAIGATTSEALGAAGLAHERAASPDTEDLLAAVLRATAPVASPTPGDRPR